MKLHCDGLSLSEATLKVSKALATRSINPILEGIKLSAKNDVLTLTATDLELSIEKKIKADVFVEGETVVQGKLFAEFVKSLSQEEVQMSLEENNRLKITYTDSEVYFQCVPAEEFPRLRVPARDAVIRMKAKDFKDIVNKTAYAVSVDDTRPVLKGVYFETEGKEIKAVALDGYRMALSKAPIVSEEKVQVLIPAKSLNELLKFIEEEDKEIELITEKNYLMVDFEHTLFITRLIDGEFINYNKIIPADFTTVVTVKKEIFEKSLDRAILLSRFEKNNMVKFDIKENVLLLSTQSEQGNLKETVNIILKGKDLQIAFNARYYTEALKSVNDEFIKISFNGNYNPCIIEPMDGNGYLFLILPVRMFN